MTQDGSVNWSIVLVTRVFAEASAFFLQKNQTFKKNEKHGRRKIILK